MQKIVQKFFVAGVMVSGLFATACRPKPIPVVVDPVNAVAEIIVSAFDADSDKDVSNDPALKISASSSSNASISVSGNVIKLEGSPEISQQTVTVNAEFNGKKASTSVSVSALREGGNAAYSANVIFEATPPQKVAKAIVEVSVWDNESESDVTAQSSFTPVGVPASYSCEEGDDKGTFVITGEGGISAFQLTVKATFGDAAGETDVINIDDIAAGAEKMYKASISLGTPHEDHPAVAIITVTAFDETLNADVTESTEITAELEDNSEASVAVEDNIVTITAGESLEIAAQDVTICAKYGDESIEKVVTLSKIEKNGSAKYNCEVVFNEKEEATYSLRLAETKMGAPVLIQLKESDSHIYTHSYSHDGLDITNWLYNDSEFLINAVFTWTKVCGVKEIVSVYAADCADEDKAKVDEYAKTFKLTYNETKDSFKHQVSAYARYTAYSTRTPKYETYEVVCTTGTDETVVGTIKVTSWNSDVKYLETSIPGHEGHYFPDHGHDYGHGHGHDHGHGGSNAGGGIISAE